MAAETLDGSPGIVDAFECHARGRRFFHRLEKGTLEQARTPFEKALVADPAYAPALAGLAAVYAMRFPFQTDPRELQTSADYARRAIAADPDLAAAALGLEAEVARLRGDARPDPDDPPQF